VGDTEGDTLNSTTPTTSAEPQQRGWKRSGAIGLNASHLPAAGGSVRFSARQRGDGAAARGPTGRRRDAAADAMDVPGDLPLFEDPWSGRTGVRCLKKDEATEAL
jgi:hypothetical protein